MKYMLLFLCSFSLLASEAEYQNFWCEANKGVIPTKYWLWATVMFFEK